MKINLLLFLNSLFLLNTSFSQAPEIQWENSIGGNNYDYARSIYQTPDGGYIIGGTSMSDISIDKTEDNWGSSDDYWIVKTDSDGIVQWDNTIGGTSTEGNCIVQPTLGGGYIVGGFSESPISGDKTTNSYGSSDYWILKLNGAGGIIWQKKIGGSSADLLTSIEQTADGGYIAGGYSFSPVSGNKDEGNIGGADYYIVKLTATGAIQWQNNIGGSADDYLTNIHQTSDDGYIVSGYSMSGLSGDKTEGSLSPGYNDYWVIKLDNSGNIQWQNTIGGNLDDFLIEAIEGSDGGIVLAGYSYSTISGDKTEITLLTDPWIVKLNSTGEIIWENTIQEAGQSISSIRETTDGGFIIGGYNGFYLYKLLANGDLSWYSSYGAAIYDLRQTSDEGYILACSSTTGISDFKSEPNYGASDYWIAKLYPNVCIPVIEVCNSMDDNCNGSIDDGVIETISISADGPTTICSGAELDLIATHSGTSIQWKKNGVNISGATSSTYSATTTGTYSAQTSSACDTEISNEIYVHVNKKPNAFIYADGPTSFCAGGSVTLIANTAGGLSYQWYKGASPIAGATNINYVATTTGNYKCLVTKIVSGCSKQSNAIAVAVTCKEENEISISEQFIIYPNPSIDKITITISSTKLTTHHSPLTITDLSGKIIAQLNISSPETEIDISNYPTGIYFVKMIIDNKQLTEKFIKQ